MGTKEINAVKSLAGNLSMSSKEINVPYNIDESFNRRYGHGCQIKKMSCRGLDMDTKEANIYGIVFFLSKVTETVTLQLNL